MNSHLRSALTACLLSPFSALAYAADLTPATNPETMQVEAVDGWKLSFTPYFWAAGLTGDLSVLGLPTVHTDASFGDVWNHLDFAVMAMGEARNEPYSVFFDIIYIDLSGSAAAPRGILAEEASISRVSSVRGRLPGGRFQV